MVPLPALEGPDSPCRSPSAPARSRASVWVGRISLDVDRDLDRLARDCLSLEDRERAARGTADVRRRRILLRAGLRLALGRLLGLPPRDVPLGTILGRPVLTDPRAPLQLSCSASAGLGLVAIGAGCSLGVDVERRVTLDVAAAGEEGWLTAREQRALLGLPRAARASALTRCWTQKEAVLKARGVGLRQHPVTVETPVADHGRIGPWWLRPVPAGEGYVASMAVTRPVGELAVVVDDMTMGDTP